MIAECVYSLLSADAGVGAIAGDRIYPNFAQQGIDEPHIVYQQISERADVLSDGSIDERGTARFDIRCFGRQGFEQSGYADAKDLSAAVKSAVRGLRGNIVSAGGCQMTHGVVENTIDRYDTNGEYHSVNVDVLLHYCEEVN